MSRDQLNTIINNVLWCFCLPGCLLMAVWDTARGKPAEG